MSKRHLLLTTAAAAALVGAMTTASMAFDEVTWDWTSHVTTNVTVDPEIPAVTALTQVEKAQVQIGNVTASANTSNVDGADVPVVPLANIDTSATAVGNNQNITSNTATFLNDGQFTYGAATVANLDVDADDLADAASALFGIDNSHLAFGLGVVAGEALDVITPATITATSTTSGVTSTNSNINNNATAVANNTNVNVDVGEGGDNLLIGDLTQVAVANVTAGATLTGVATSLGDINNHATAVGNNVNINVGPVPSP
jgi:hypothetical protein